MFIIQLLYSDDLIVYYIYIILNIILHSYKCDQLILIIEFVPKMKQLCFDLMLLSKISSYFSSNSAFSGFKVNVINDLLCDILLSLIIFWSDYFSSRWMLFSDKQNYNQLNWNYMAKSRYHHNILQIFRENCYIFIFYLP